MGPLAVSRKYSERSLPSQRLIRERELSIARTALILASSATVLFLAFVYYFRLVRVSSVLGFKEGDSRVLRVYNRFLGFHPDLSDTVIPGRLGPIQMRIYTPRGAKNPPPAVLIHGFADKGNREVYLNFVAYQLAGMGFMVTLPTVPSETHQQVRASDLSVIGDSIRWTAERAHQKVSVFGISFSGGLVIPAAAQPAVSPDVKLVFCLSGYDDLDRIAKYFIHESVFDPHGHRYEGNPPGPLVVSSQYLDDLVPPDEAAAVGSAVYAANRGK